MDPSFRLVEYYPISAKDQSRIHQFGKNVLLGLFLGSVLYAEGIWKGDILVANMEELETIYVSEIYAKRLNAKEVISPKENGQFISSRRWMNQSFWRRSGTENTHLDTRDHPIRGGGQRDFLGESEGSLPSPPQDSLPDAGEAINDFWSVHVRKLHFPPSR